MAATEADPISAQGFCLEHGLARLNDNNLQISARQGPYYERWVRRSFMAAHAKVLDLQQTG